MAYIPESAPRVKPAPDTEAAEAAFDTESLPDTAAPPDTEAETFKPGGQHGGWNRLVTVREAMRDLGISRGLFYKLVAAGEIRTVLISPGARRVSRRALEDFIHAREARSTPPKSAA